MLVVEDDPDVRAHSVEILRELGYATLDVGLPGGMNGRQVAEEALRLRPRLKVLLATGYARGAIVEGEKLPAGVEIIGKPFEFATLGARLGAVLRDGARSRILVVEDEALLRMSLVQDLEALGFDVKEAASAAQALENANGICAAIIDVGLPGMKGDALAAELRKRDAVLPLIIASGYGEAQIRDRLKPDAFTRFLGKPYNAGQREATLGDLGLQISGSAGLTS